MNKQRANKYQQAKNYGKAKLSAHEVELIRQIVESGELTQNEVALKFEISKCHASRIVNFKRR